MTDLMAIDDVERGQRRDPTALERWLEREIKPRQRLDRCQTRHLRVRLDATAFAMVSSSTSSISIASITVA